MESLTFSEVTTQAQIHTTAQLAREIWTQHYTPLIGSDQVSYMLDKFQSPEAILRQIDCENYRYFLLLLKGVPVGYIGVVPEGDRLFLSKLYVRQVYRRRGFAAQAIDHCVRLCAQLGLSKIYLTVNRHNSSSVTAYEKMGFVTVREQVADIGGGFVMDDFIMEKVVPIQA